MNLRCFTFICSLGGLFLQSSNKGKRELLRPLFLKSFHGTDRILTVATSSPRHAHRVRTGGS